MKEVPIAFAKVKEDDAIRWEEKSKSALDFISKLDDPSNFSWKDVKEKTYYSTISRLIFENKLEKNGYNYSLLKK
jgi:predicted membrane-bound spermidine synthase